jgi:hypothetical protein
MRRAALAFLLLAAGYAAGATTPASAYTQDETRLMNQIVGELRGIRSSLQSIERKMR